MQGGCPLQSAGRAGAAGRGVPLWREAGGHSAILATAPRAKSTLLGARDLSQQAGQRLPQRRDRRGVRGVVAEARGRIAIGQLWNAPPRRAERRVVRRRVAYSWGVSCGCRAQPRRRRRSVVRRYRRSSGSSSVGRGATGWTPARPAARDRARVPARRGASANAPRTGARRRRARPADARRRGIAPPAPTPRHRRARRGAPTLAGGPGRNRRSTGSTGTPARRPTWLIRPGAASGAPGGVASTRIQPASGHECLGPGVRAIAPNGDVVPQRVPFAASKAGHVAGRDPGRTQQQHRRRREVLAVSLACREEEVRHRIDARGRGRRAWSCSRAPRAATR